ncbi:DMT family transporter [Streptomyces sp. NPDC058369]|uniref:DMT family transporter n=1 Tax=unclassified Streptomyces TaxID=2593676 RepID=UPI0022512BF4|nr:DMT family transporter [Streptomyces sp. NBC_01789]MCX4451443.1 DMT family transporter [Streptomyces sp. NBC_01789]
MAEMKTAAAAAGGLVTALAFGGMFAVAKSAFGHVDPFHLTLARFALGSAIFVIALLAVEGRRALRTDGKLLKLWGLGSLGFAAFNLLTYVGLQSTPASTASLIMAAMPAITVIVMWARTGKRPTGITLGLVLLALTGVAMVLGNGNPLVVLTGGIGAGGLTILAGVVGWVVYATGAAGFPAFSVLRYTALTSALGTVTIAAVTLTAGAAAWIPNPSAADYVADWWQILYMAVPATAVAILAFNHATRTLGPANGVLFINLVPITAFAIEAVRGHRPTTAELAGVALTLAAVIANNVYGRRVAKRAGASASAVVAGSAVPPESAASATGPASAEARASAEAPTAAATTGKPLTTAA